jgi:hypothetical protein
MSKKKESEHSNTPPAPTDSPSRDEAFLRLAEELGRIVGKFLADQAATRPRATPPPAPDSTRK